MHCTSLMLSTNIFVFVITLTSLPSGIKKAKSLYFGLTISLTRYVILSLSSNSEQS